MERNMEMKDPNDTPSLGKGNSGSFIPEDVLSQCLVRLPVKSLIRFKAVSRSWKNLISTAGFAEMHFLHSQSNEQLLGVGLHPEKYYPEMSLLKLRGSKDAKRGDGFGNVLLPFCVQPLESVVIEGSCNGLLVFRTKSIPGIVLCNPATREFRRLGLPFNEVRFSTSIGLCSNRFCTSIGLCFISETKDYKIIAVQNIYGERSNSGTESYPGWVYSLNSDSWKKLDVAFPYINNRELGLSGMATVFNECVHWIADEDEGRIAAFDVKNEIIQYMSLPVPELLVRGFGRLLTIIEGSISVVMSLENEVRYLGFEVWKMNEYGVEASWTRLFIVKEFQICVQAMGSWKDRRILFKYYSGNGDRLFSYDPSTRKIEAFNMSPILNLQVINYVESMESVEGGMRKISQNRMMAKPTGEISTSGCTSGGSDSGNLSTGVVISSGQDNKKEDDSKGPTSGKQKHDNRTLEESRSMIIEHWKKAPATLKEKKVPERAKESSSRKDALKSSLLDSNLP